MPKRYDTPARNEVLKAATFDALMGKEPESETVEVLLKPTLAKVVERAEERLNRAQSEHRVDRNDPARQLALSRAEKDYEAAKDEAAAVTVTMNFTEISRVAYDDLLAKHPADDDERLKGLGVHMDSFERALIAASSSDPKLTEDQVRELQERYGAGFHATLFGAATRVNNRMSSVDLGKG